jgi:formamidopyrimidine-DNA glycosylase
MPELPEVECVRRSLAPHLLGRRLVGAMLHRADVCRGPGRRPVGRALPLGVVTSLRRHGKQLAVCIQDRAGFVVHLGMTGQLLHLADGLPSPPHTHCEWRIEPGPGRLVFRDPRRFGRLTPFAGGEDLARAWSAMGPDALTISPIDLARGLAGSARAIKAALLDQRVLAGVGNIYADEALHRAGISPRRRAGRLGGAGALALAGAIREVLSEAVEAGGSTLRDYLDADARPGGFGPRHRVYGRGGLACLSCGGRLRSAVIAQRTTVWCGTCQK